MKSLPIAGQHSPTRMSFAEALQSPCETCAASPCCTHLPLHTFTADTLAALDHARYLLGFEHIQLGISSSGEWSVYYRSPCRYLDRESHGCTVHDSVLQPRICVHYNPYRCWYKRSLSSPVSDDFIPLDRRRLDFILEHVQFDQNRTVVEVPDWPSMHEAMKGMELDPIADSDLADDPVFDQWLERAATGRVAPVDAPHHAADLGDPCAGCQAHCCKTLVFPGAVPASMASFDYMRFALGFPNIEIGVSDRGWSIIVRTTCRHLVDNRCSIYGRPERPLICKYYDAQSCHYKAQFGVTRPEQLFRFRLEQWHWVIEAFTFDEHGVIIEGPSMEKLRQHVEARWREHVVQAASAARTEDPPDQPKQHDQHDA